MADLYAAYRVLPEDERRILRALSVVCEPITQTSLQRVLTTLDWRGQAGAPLSLWSPPGLANRWLDAGLIEQV
ncbi:MAG TPA: hypothetical protein VLM84_00450, partial [Chromatiaceae bacterium]|nr:hypothetical protein [Chromatiaceae bacterium]